MAKDQVEQHYHHLYHNKLPADVAEELATTAKKLVVPGKGILAADEGAQTIKKRFDTIKIENTVENRANYRDLLFGAKGLGKFISGVILFEETLFQKNEAGVQLVKLLHEEGIIPGIKVDKGLVDLPRSDHEKATQGLDGLAERCQEYYKAGARFAKWRAVVNVDVEHGKPSELSIRETAWTLARYASICQHHRIVPIVEPEVLADGNHGIEVCAHVTERVLHHVFEALHQHGVLLEGALLKPNMVTPGYECPNKASPQDVAFFTVRTLKRSVPPALPGVVFLSGGQSEEEATLNLNAINVLGPHPWALTFSFARALQNSVLLTWQGKKENVAKAREVLLKRAEANAQATEGKYEGGAVCGHATASLYEKKYVY